MIFLRHDYRTESQAESQRNFRSGTGARLWPRMEQLGPRYNALALPLTEPLSA